MRPLASGASGSAAPESASWGLAAAGTSITTHDNPPVQR